MRGQIAFVAVAWALGCVMAGVCGRTSAAPAGGPRAFCAANPNDDNPTPSYSEAKAPEVPPDVAKAGANAWRCMDGKVFVCHIGADGYPCQKLDPNPSAAKPVRDFCAAHPGSDFVPMYVIGASATTWRCQGAEPQALKTETLDKRDFLKSVWKPLSD